MAKSRSSSSNDLSAPSASVKRRCVSSACIACRRRKSKCDGNTPSCAPCASVYHTPCVYDPASDHRRKGVYKKDIAELQSRNATLQTLIQAILTYSEEDVIQLVRQMRSSKSLNEVAASVLERQSSKFHLKREGTPDEAETGIRGGIPFEDELTGKMNQLKLDGSVKLIGGTSNLLFLPSGLEMDSDEQEYAIDSEDDFNDPVTRWTNATNDRELILHLLKLYFTWHYGYFTALSKKRFERDFYRGRLSEYCSPLLVNTMLAIGSHFSSWPAARENPKDSATAGDHFFREAKRLILENNEYERSRLCTVQALALMSVREAGCGREGSGWVYSGMSFRMALDLGLNVDPNELGPNNFSEEELDARRITFWGCFLFDKYWSNYLGRQPQLSGTNITVPIFDIDPEEEKAPWVPYTDSGMALEGLEQPARSRTISRQIIHLCEISNDLLSNFYRPSAYERNMGKHEEFRNLHRIHAKLEAWKRDLPEELQVKNTLLPQALLMHMFYQLLFIHLYRPFLKYTKSIPPLPPNATPRKICSQAAFAISNILRTYKETYGLRLICNIAVYIVHSACTIHLLSLPEKSARRDLINGLSSLEEIAESWLCARRTLRIIDILAAKWNIELPDEAEAVLHRCYVKFGPLGTWDRVRSSTGQRSLVLQALPQEQSKEQPNIIAPSMPQSAFINATSAPPHDVFIQSQSQYQPAHSLPMPGGGLQTPQLMMPPTPEKPSAMQQQYFPHGAPAFLSTHNGFSGTSSGHGNWIPPPSQTAVSNNGNGNDARPLDAARFPNISHPDVYAAMHNEQHMVEASHHWWLNDQAALALSLENQRGLWNAQNDFRGPSSGVHTPAESSQMPSTMFNMQQPPTPEECRQTMHEPKVDGGNALPNAKVMHLPMNYHGYTYSSN